MTQLAPAMLGAYAFIGGLVTLSGWFANIPRLAGWENNGIAMMPNAAVCAMGGGTALMLRAFRCRRGLVTSLAVLVGLIGAATLLEFISGINLGIDTLLAAREWEQRGTVSPGRMGVPASTCWIILGLALALAYGGVKMRRAAVAGGLLAVAIAMLSLVGYLFGASPLFTIPRLTAIALQTATMILGLGIGIIMTVSDRQPMKMLRADTTAGLLARRALPFIIFLPLVLGLLRVRGQEAGLYDTAFGTALRTLVELAFLAALLWWALATVAAKETALRREQERLSQTLESITDGFHVIDAEGRFTYFNSAARKMFAEHALQTDALLGRSIFEVFPDAREIEVGREIQHTLNERVATNAESFYAPWQRWFSVRNYPTPEGGVATYFQDITERQQAEKKLRESEERFRALADNIPQLAWLAAPGTDGQATWFNKAWLDYTGTTLEQNQGSGWQAVHHPDYAEAVIRKFEHHVHENLDWEDTFPLRGKDGEYRWFLSRMNVLRDESGTPTRIFGTNTDITQLRNAEEALRESEARARSLFEAAEAARLSAEAAKSRAEAATRAKDEFLAALSHELRTPLNPALLLASSLADDAELSSRLRKDIEIIAQAISLQAQLVDDLLDITRITGGKLRLDLRALDAHNALRHACEIVAGETEDRHVEITLDLAAPEHFIEADAVRLQQIFWNVLKNAVKFTEPGGAITVRTCNPVENKDALLIEITDTGIGIEAEMLEHIFDAFVQEEHTSAHRFGGIGLGLSITRKLIELQGGRIQARSGGRDQGATFSIELPLATAVALPERDSLSPAPPAAPNQPPRHILLVEDHELTRTTLARLLQRRGHHVAIAATAAQARELAATCECDLIISDLGLPDGDGHALLVELRNAHNLPAIALSGYGMEEDRERSRKSGFFVHLTKPIDMHALENAIGAAPLKESRV